MGRHRRIWLPDYYYHVVSRGNRREPLFHDSVDFESFIRILDHVHEKAPFSIASYCLMTNHFHLQIRFLDQPMYRVMAMINKRYATYYNTRYSTSGHVFEKRYFSKPIVTIEGMLEVSRYIHLNPVRANIFELPEQYQWSSFRIYQETDGEQQLSFFYPEAVLDLFNGKRYEQLKKYEHFVYEALESIELSIPF